MFFIIIFLLLLHFQCTECVWQDSYSVTYYPPILNFPLIYDLTKIIPISVQGFQVTPYVYLDPVDTTNALVRISNAAYQTPFPLTGSGIKFAKCRHYNVSATNVNLPRLNYLEIFCTNNQKSTIQTYEDMQYSSNIHQPEYVAINCTELPNNWYSQAPSFDPTFQSVFQIPFTGTAPQCFTSKTCYHTFGLPKMPFDGPTVNFQLPQQQFYCCRTITEGAPTGISTSKTSIWNITCITQFYNQKDPAKITKYVTATRSVQVNYTMVSSEQVVSWSKDSAYNIQVECVWPYITPHYQVGKRNPMPTSIGCAISDIESLCTLDATFYKKDLCPGNGVEMIGMRHYSVDEVNMLKLGDQYGIVTKLDGDLTLPASSLLTYTLFERSWDLCNEGKIGCIVYCHCWNGCPNNEKCSFHGTLYETPRLGQRESCMCNPGYSGDICEFNDPDRLCNVGQRSSKEITSSYYVGNL
jgi:hypothetical protein